MCSYLYGTYNDLTLQILENNKESLQNFNKITEKDIMNLYRKGPEPVLTDEELTNLKYNIEAPTYVKLIFRKRNSIDPIYFYNGLDNVNKRIILCQYGITDNNIMDFLVFLKNTKPLTKSIDHDRVIDTYYAMDNGEQVKFLDTYNKDMQQLASYYKKSKSENK